MSPLATPDTKPVFQSPKLGGGSPKKPKGILGGLLLGAIALLLISGATRMVAVKKPADAVQVVAAGQDIPAGCKLGFTSLHYTKIPAQYVTKDMFTSYDQLVGRTSKSFVRMGEPLTNRTVMAPGQEPASALIKGLRAITLSLEPDGVVDNLVNVGDRVDVISTVSKENQRYTKTICQNLLVLVSVSREALLADRNRVGDTSRVTLAARPEDCELLSEAASLGKLRLLLRSGVDAEQADLPGVDEKDVLPASAFKTEQPIVTSSVRELMTPPAPPVMPPPPQAMMETAPALPAAPAVQNPVNWIVDMFSGSKKEAYEVPAR